MLLESQYSQFKQDLNKPKGGTAFITDFDRKEKLLAIGHSQPEGDNKQPVAVGTKPSENKPIAVAMPPVPEENDLPKFEDD